MPYSHLHQLPPPPQGRSGWPWTDETPEPEVRCRATDGLPSISIVTPSYNQGRFLEQTIRSVLLQGYPKLEYIVLDGASADESPDVLQRYTGQIAYWRSAPDEGQSDAIRHGFDLARGDVLGWLNADDVLLPGALLRVGRYFREHPEVECAVGGTLLIDEADRILRNPLGLPRIVRGERETLLRLLARRGLSFYQAAAFWRAGAYHAAGGMDPGLTFAMDYDLFLRFARAKPFGHVDALLAGFRVHPESKTSRLQEVYRREVKELLKRHGRDDLTPTTRVLFRGYLKIFNFFNNLPMRLAVASGRVRLPYPPG